MSDKIVNKFLNFLEKEMLPPIKRDFSWFNQILAEDLEKLTKSNKKSKKKKYKSKD